MINSYDKKTYKLHNNIITIYTARHDIRYNFTVLVKYTLEIIFIYNYKKKYNYISVQLLYVLRMERVNDG